MVAAHLADLAEQKLASLPQRMRTGLSLREVRSRAEEACDTHGFTVEERVCILDAADASAVAACEVGGLDGIGDGRKPEPGRPNALSQRRRSGAAPLRQIRSDATGGT